MTMLFSWLVAALDKVSEYVDARIDELEREANHQRREAEHWEDEFNSEEQRADQAEEELGAMREEFAKHLSVTEPGPDTVVIRLPTSLGVAEDLSYSLIRMGARVNQDGERGTCAVVDARLVAKALVNA